MVISIAERAGKVRVDPLPVVHCNQPINLGSLNPIEGGWEWIPPPLRMRYDGSFLHVSGLDAELYCALRRHHVRYCHRLGSPDVSPNAGVVALHSWHHDTTYMPDDNHKTTWRLQYWIGSSVDGAVPFGLDFVREIYEDIISVHLERYPQINSDVVGDFHSIWFNYKVAPQHEERNTKRLHQLCDGLKKALDDPTSRRAILKHIS